MATLSFNPRSIFPSFLFQDTINPGVVFSECM
jgi:hypothetical protein